MTETEPTSIVEEMKKPGIFSLADYLSENVSYPEDKVTVYLDAHTGAQLMRLNDQKAVLDDKLSKMTTAKAGRSQRTLDGQTGGGAKEDILAELEALSNEIEKLDDKIKSSALVFSLRGIAPSEVERISGVWFTDEKKDYSGSEEERSRDAEIIVSSVVSVENAQGDTSTGFTSDDLAALRSQLLPGEFGKLLVAVARVSMTSQLFDLAVDAPFPGRRAELA